MDQRLIRFNLSGVHLRARAPRRSRPCCRRIAADAVRAARARPARCNRLRGRIRNVVCCGSWSMRVCARTSRPGRSGARCRTRHRTRRRRQPPDLEPRPLSNQCLQRVKRHSIMRLSLHSPASGIPRSR
jgi:hypothetical protein